MNSFHDIYCSRCDTYHEEGTEGCRSYWNNHDGPLRARMFAIVGKVFKLKEPTPILYGNDGMIAADLPPGTFVRLTNCTPDTYSTDYVDYWFTIQTLDRKLSATQIYQDELEGLDALDRLSILGEPRSQPMS